MNCKKVEELLPLYVGRELEEESARLVTTHVRACSDCARCAREYSESTQLLQLFEPPQFSEATYVAVRSRVLREIEREASAPTLLQLLARLFQPRVRWAVSTAVLLAVCVFAYYFIANRTNGPQERANASSQPSKLKDLPAPKPDPTGTADVRDPGPGSPAGVLDPPAMATNSPRPRIKQTAWHSQRAGETPAVPVRSAKYSSAEPQAATPNASVTSEKTLRLEIQTSDRNIRIIWFSHPSTNEGSPNESSKGI